jgi:flavin reductase (NADH)
MSIMPQIARVNGPADFDLPDSFRQAMSEVALAVHVVSTAGQGGEGAMTASSVCSVSVSPPTLLVCVARSARINARIKANGRLCVNALALSHVEVAEACANLKGKNSTEELTSKDWMRGGQFTCPVLHSSIFSCEGCIRNTSEIATHSVFFVEIDQARVGTEERSPLIWHRRRFASAVAADAY